jgi:hypothetical protein
MQKEDIAYAPSSGEDFGRIVELPKPHPNGNSTHQKNPFLSSIVLHAFYQKPFDFCAIF